MWLMIRFWTHRWWRRLLCIHWDAPAARIPIHNGMGRMFLYRCPGCDRTRVEFL